MATVSLVKLHALENGTVLLSIWKTGNPKLVTMGIVKRYRDSTQVRNRTMKLSAVSHSFCTHSASN